jgi:large subunit ribosomal protein L6
MSRLGKLPVETPKGVEIKINGQTISAKGPKGQQELTLVDHVVAKMEDGAIVLAPANDSKEAKAMWGMSRSLLRNLVQGVSEGFEKNLELVGVGYRAQMRGRDLVLQLGYSHEVVYSPPAEVTITSGKPTEVKVSGPDKQVVGQVASEIRSWRPPEPYKGKGVRYVGEFIRRKEGKKK